MLPIVVDGESVSCFVQKLHKNKRPEQIQVTARPKCLLFFPLHRPLCRRQVNDIDQQPENAN